jgi:hypothetical protein
MGRPTIVQASVAAVAAAAAASPDGNPTRMHRTATPTPKYFAFWSTSPEYSPIFSHSRIFSILLLLSSAGPFASLVRPCMSLLSLYLLRIAFLFTGILSLLHETGALRRYALKFAEVEISKNLNGALVTLSDGEFDLWRGKAIVRDFVIHNKDRDVWEWDSPCLARVGRIEATLNFSSVIKLPYYGQILEHKFFDVYTVLIEDVQVFVEKRKNVFNFHLLDPSLNIPDHSRIMDEYYNYRRMKRSETGGRDGETTSAGGTSRSSNMDKKETRGWDMVRDVVRDGTPPAKGTVEDANKIVEKLVGAVSKIGNAANEGGSRALQSALRNQKDGLVQNLKQLRSHKTTTTTSTTTTTTDGGGTMPSDRKDWESTTKHGVSVMRELGRVVEKNVLDMKTSLSLLQRPPEKKEGWQSKSPDYIRVGSALLREGRIFTKDILLPKGGGGGGHGGGECPTKSAAHYANGYDRSHMNDIRGQETTHGWARPIVIVELAITGAELSPPMSARDPTDGMPLVGIPLDRLLDIVQKRIMAEIAKTETGRLYQTAFGDVFSFVGENSAGKES